MPVTYGAGAAPAIADSDARKTVPAGRLGAPEVEVEALAFQLRAGVKALKESSALLRLADLNESQMRKFAERLTRERWNKAGTGKLPPWTADEIKTFVHLWGIANG